MTLEELNALYEATDFGNQGNYIAPTTSNIDLTAPVVEGIPAIQPYIPPFIPIEGDGRPTDTPTDPMSFGNLGIKGYNQANIAGPVKNSITDIIGNLYNAYTNVSPLHLGIKGIKKSIDIVKKIQKQKTIEKEIKLQEEIAESNKQAARQAKYDTQVSQGRAPGGYYGSPDYSGGLSGDQAQAGPGRDADDRMAKGGRIGYGTGGIVTL